MKSSNKQTSPLKNLISRDKSPSINKIEGINSNLNNVEDKLLVIEIITNISNLVDIKKRDTALSFLSKQREDFKDLAIYLWYTPGIITIL